MILKLLAIDDSPGTNRNERVLSSFDAKQNRLQDQVDNLEKQVKSLAPSESAPPLINWRRCAEHHQQRSKSYEEQIAKLYSAVNEQNEIIKKLGMSVFRRFQGIAPRYGLYEPIGYGPYHIFSFSERNWGAICCKGYSKSYGTFCQILFW